ncbi:carbohydrate esterase [Xylographa parallela]|nr:carbohydrate esterase [Xylographa parallela]
MQLPTRITLALLPALLALAAPVENLEKRACPNVHIFGARETTASPGYGSSSTVVNGVLAAYPGSTAEAINYPACGGQASCGGDSYSQSLQAGIAAAASAINNYNTQCPNTKLVLVGYSQGSEIFDVSFCGGGDPNQGYTNKAVLITAKAVAQIKAAIFMGDPAYHYGLPYDVGTCTAGGVRLLHLSNLQPRISTDLKIQFDARPAGFSCSNASKIKSYCDATDPYCCNGNNPATHQGYGAEYGNQAIAFVKSQVGAA